MRSAWPSLIAVTRAIVAIAVAATTSRLLPAQEPAVHIDQQGRLRYAQNEHGDRIVDFSHCGYGAGNEDPPQAPVVVVVDPAPGDDRARIQAAIDYVAQQPLRTDGIRGAVRLTSGEFEIGEQLHINASGVVLQGSGADANGCTLRATGERRRALIRLGGIDDRRSVGTSAAIEIVDRYVPVGATSIAVADASSFAVGNHVIITRPSTAAWVEFVSKVGWKAGRYDLRWDRPIKAIEGNAIVFDAPITTAIDKTYGAGRVFKYEWPDRLRNVGVEDVALVSDYRPDQPHDEDHAWYGVLLDNVQDAWVRRTTFRHFSGGAVHVGKNGKSVLIEDCIASNPISEIGGYRRHTFFTLGQMTLFHRCWSERGRHDFAVGHCAPGPNAFVQCYAKDALGESGPIESWASGVLYDNVRIDGNDLQLSNRWNNPPRAGWAAANCVLWQCRAAGAACFRPPGANNWAIGVWATPSGDGAWESVSDFVRPLSLYHAQLAQRRGTAAAERFDPVLGRSVGATNPTYQEASNFAKKSAAPARQLVDLIRDEIDRHGAARRQREPHSNPGVISIKELMRANDERQGVGRGSDAGVRLGRTTIENGWLTCNGKVQTGKLFTPIWWRGTLIPEDAAQFGPNISRFAPAREGDGLTNDLASVARRLAAEGYGGYEHHYGLWYDRRRDDHLMVRRADGAVAPPFYEQPFARTGRGVAWDGLSKFDLEKFNPWYWTRLQRFAAQCQQHGIVLLHHHYFQHNILEAGAHWADCPWRPANNVNATGLPEPPPYVGDKRIFMDQSFYNPNNAGLRKLHRGYIRQCLETLANRSNVIQLTSEEYTGPLEFVEFWIDVAIQWKKEFKNQALIGLSCTKDVQDAILADPARAPHVDVIDIRYWTYDKEMQLVAPKSGMHLAPRQHIRQLKPKESSFASIVNAVAEYRRKFPGKAILYNADQHLRSRRNGWAELMGGGSLAPVALPDPLASEILGMLPTEGPVDPDDGWCLASPDRRWLLYLRDSAETISLDVNGKSGEDFHVRWINSENGEITSEAVVPLEALEQLPVEGRVVWIESRAAVNAGLQ